MPSSLADHPPIQPEKIGVLLLNLGTPDATDYFSVRRYLSEFLGDRRVIDYPRLLWQPLLQGVILSIRPFKSGAAYRSVWNNDKNESPLKTYTRSQCEQIESRLQKQFPNLVFEWAMRYGNPPIKSGIETLLDRGCRKILLFALYPQYSACTSASAYDKAFATLQTIPWQPAIRTASPWHDDDGYVSLLADSVTKKLAGLDREPDVILTSFHGLPKRYLKQGDPYYCMCMKTSRLVREKLGLDEKRWITTFQSRFGPEQWLEPYTDKTIKDLAEKGVKHIAVLSPAFVSECIETLEEIAIEGKETFLKAGGHTYTYIPCLNDTSAHIDYLSARIRFELSGWIKNTP